MRDSAAVLRALGALDDDTLASLKPKLDAVAMHNTTTPVVIPVFTKSRGMSAH